LQHLILSAGLTLAYISQVACGHCFHKHEVITIRKNVKLNGVVSDSCINKLCKIYPVMAMHPVTGIATR